MEYSELTSMQKIAILLSQFPDLAPKVLKYFSEEEIQEITLEIASLGEVKQIIVEKVIEEFYSYYEANKYIAQGGVEVARKILESVFPKEKVEEILMKMTQIFQATPLECVRKLDPIYITNIVQDAHPQIIAILLAYMNDAKKSAIVLSSLKKDKMDLVIKGLADLEETGPSDEMIRQLEIFLENKMGNLIIKKQNVKIGGLDAVVPIMNSVDSVTEETILTNLSQKDPELAQEIKNRMFVFEDLIKLNDRDIQRILMENINDREMAICLKFTNEKIKEQLQEKFFKNMSNRKVELIKEEIASIGRIKKKEVEEAKQKIVDIAKSLAEKGEIIITAGTDEYIE